jgi:putative RNA 2'-phosphotransferase
MSWLLRHGAFASGLVMDEAGWVSVDAAIAQLGVTRAEIEAAVSADRKQRFELRGERLRACQGHSRAGMPVTLEALEASWSADLRETPIWHGTRAATVAAILRDGLLPGPRTHVHLAPSPDSPIGKRARVEVLLEVSPPRLRAAGLTLFRSPNGVLLARAVPPNCLLAPSRP